MMENKNIILIAVVIIAFIVIAGVFLSGIFSNSNNGIIKPTTSFNNSFMEGAFTGDNVKLVNNTTGYMQSYKDANHNITYNISTVDNSTALMDIYYVQGVMNPEKRSFNGNDWNIYFSQAYEGNNTNDTISIVICQSQGPKQGYLIYMIVGSKSDVNTTALNVYGDVYTQYVEPLLKSVKLKESGNAPAINDEFGLTADEFAQQMELVQQFKAGNTSALQTSGEQ